jgi:rfaE bifunctional protein nucleotidyltransferase chain/domain
MNDFQASNKLESWEAATARVKKARQAGQRIAFTNGCFDILHAGHVRYLAAARATADMLVVGLNSDASVRMIKGVRRPLNPATLRAEVLAGLRCVDCVVLFEEPDPLALIKALQPDVLVKGADWSEDRIIGADVVKQRGGRVERIDLVPDISTSTLIDKIIERFC